MIGILVSFWDGLFSGAMLVFWRVDLFNRAEKAFLFPSGFLGVPKVLSILAVISIGWDVYFSKRKSRLGHNNMFYRDH